MAQALYKCRPALTYGCQLGPNDQALRVVWESARLQGDNALAWDGLCDVGVVRVDDGALEHAVGVSGTVRVGQDDLVAVLQRVQIPEHEITPGAGETQAMASDIDVGPPLPGEPRAIQVERPVVERTLIMRGARVDGHAFYTPHLGDGQGHGRVAWRLLRQESCACEGVAHEEGVPHQNQPGHYEQGGYEVAKHPEPASSRPVGSHVNLLPLHRFRSLSSVGYTAKVTIQVTKWPCRCQSSTWPWYELTSCP